MAPTEYSSLAQFSQALVALCNSTDLDVLPCVHAARDVVATALGAVNASPLLIRLAKADLLETALARAVAVIEDAPRCKQLPTPELRANFLALHLEVVIVGWIRERTEMPKELASLVEVERLIVAKPR